MTALKQELINCINDIPDNKLIAIKPLLFMLSNETAILERVSFNELTSNEQKAVLKGREEYKNGECIDFEDYLAMRGIDT
jgi:hypothetical protein